MSQKNMIPAMVRLALLLFALYAPALVSAANPELQTMKGELQVIQPGKIVVSDFSFPLTDGTPVYSAKGARLSVSALRRGMLVEVVYTYPGYAVQAINIK